MLASQSPGNLLVEMLVSISGPDWGIGSSFLVIINNINIKITNSAMVLPV